MGTVEPLRLDKIYSIIFIRHLYIVHYIRMHRKAVNIDEQFVRKWVDS